MMENPDGLDALRINLGVFRVGRAVFKESIHPRRRRATENFILVKCISVP